MQGIGLVQWRWLPSPELYVKADLNDFKSTHEAFKADELILKVPGMEPVSFLPTNFQFGNLSTVSLSGDIDGFLQPTTLPCLKELNFHIPNFPSYHGRAIQKSSPTTTLGGWRAGRMMLKDSGWQVTIDNLDETSTLIKELAATGGHAITHIGRLEREDNSPFTLTEAKEFTEGLSFFLSFVAGRWTQPVLWWTPGSTPQDAPLMIIPSSLRLDSWKPSHSWANFRGPLNTEEISTLFPAFMNWFRRAPDLLRLSVSWYTEILSNKLVSDSRIVLTQVALELLAEALPPLLGQKAIKGTAEFRLRGLLKLVSPNTPLPVPASLSRLTSILTQPPADSWNKGAGGVADGPSVVISTRNKIAHGARTLAEKALLRNVMVMYEASQLGLWYMEHVLLGWFGYSGRYRSRIVLSGWENEGDVFPLPLPTTGP